MDKETFEKHKAFAGPTKPSMHRRRVGHDYQSRRIYLITMTVEGRHPLLGRLVGNADAPQGSPEAPRIELTELGERVRQCWMAIETYYPDIKVLATRVMPDHLHGILFVQQQMEVHVSQAVKGFKTGTNKVYRELCPSAATVSQQRQTEKGGYRHEGFLWSPGFNDHILEDGGELDRWFEYLRDNPRRLAVRRAHADFFRVRFGLEVGGQTFAAIGNRFLILAPWPRQNRRVPLTREMCLALNGMAGSICQ